MKRSRGKFEILAGILIGINTAGLVWLHYDLTSVPQPVVRVLFALPASDVADADRLTLVFDRPVAGGDSVGKAVPSGLFALEPAWPGKWVWGGPETAEYRLDKPLPPGRVFRVTCSDEWTARMGKPLEGPKHFQFRTAPLVLEHCELEAADREAVSFELAFNQPVEPAQLLRRIRLYDEKTAEKLPEPTCLTDGPKKKLTVRAARPTSNRLKVVLDEQLVGHQAELPLGKTATRALTISPAFGLLRTYQEDPGLKETISVTFRMSRQLDREQQPPKLTVRPPVDGLETHRSGRDLKVSGKFIPGRRYTIALPGTLLADDGQTLGADQTVTVDIPDRSPAVEIPQWRGILSPDGGMLLDVDAVNVQGLRLTGWRVHENNLVAHLRGTWREGTSRSVLDKTVPLDLPHNQPQKIALDLRGLLGEQCGIYRIGAAATNRPWEDDYAVVAVTDLAITAKAGRDELLVWVTSLRTAKPVRGTAVKAVTYNNQTLATARTDEDGLARLAIAPNHPDGPVWLVTAERKGDLSYLRPEDNRWMIDDVDREGRPHVETYEAMLYTERGVYRPGDTVHVTAVLRDAVGGVPGDFPVAMTVTRPDGKDVAELIATPEPGGQGVFHADFQTQQDGQTGPYRFRLTLPGDKRILGQTHAQVEAFLPVRMEVTAEPTADRYGPGETPAVNVSGRYLWDQPAAGLPVTVEATLRGVSFQSEKRPEFRFGPVDSDKTFSPTPVCGELDAQGKARIEFLQIKGASAVPLPEPVEPVEPPVHPVVPDSLFHLPKGFYRAQLTTTVTEPGGRSVSDAATVVVDTLDRHVGLHLPGGNVAAAEEKTPVRWVRLTGEDQPAEPGEMTLKLLRVEYDTVVKEVDGRRVWRSVVKTREVESREIEPGGSDGQLDVTCPEPGMYRLCLADKETSAATQLEFYASAPGAGPQGLAMNRPERLEIVTDKETYLPGQTAKVLVRSPMAGALWLTLETDRVAASYVAEVAHNTAELEVPLPPELRGGAFLTATVVRPVDPERKNWLPHRAMGMARIRLDHDDRRLPLTVSAPRQPRPGEPLMVTVDAGPPSDPNRPPVVHLWAVDEGILLCSRYGTPDPQRFFLSPRSPGVRTADLFFRLLPDYARPAGMARIGAGGGDDEDFTLDNLRRNPVPARQREAAVVWRTTVGVDPDGCARVEMRLPELIGQMRLMAVAVDGDRYGRAAHDLTLTQPLIVEASWPRFAAPGDTFEVPVKLFNTTDDSATLRLAASITGPLELLPASLPEVVVVAPGQPVVCFVKVKATGIGPVEARIEAEAIGLDGLPLDEPLSATSTAHLPVRPATALHCMVDLKTIPAGRKLRLDPPASLVAGTARMTVQLAGRPNVQLAPALEELIDYPHGCVEQTTSRLYSLLYARQIFDVGRREMLDEMVRAGIHRLRSMQTRSGGLSYWPGRSEPCLWSTAYAAGCLLEARNAGHEIDGAFTENIAKYLEGRLGDSEENQDHNTRALICRVMATFGRPPHGRMAWLAERKDQLDLAGRAHLAAAFGAAGRKDRALAVLPKKAPAIAVATTTAGRLTSQVRQEAVWLLVLLEYDPENPVIASLAGRLEKARQNGQWGSTLANAAAIAALSRYQAQTADDEQEFTGHIRHDGREAAKFDHTAAVSCEVGQVSGPVEISSAGTGRIYVAVRSEGLAKEGVVEPYDREMTVRRRWTDGQGKPVDPEKLRVGDLVQVAVSVRSPREVHNIAVVDALPGGMEVENPRLATSARTGQAAAATPDHVEFLDDRVVLFCSAGTEEKVFRYSLRVISAGEFQLPPVQASCMYDAGVASLGEAGRVRTQK